MSDLYTGEGDILIPTPFGVELPPSIIHAANSKGEYIEVDRAYWRDEWQVVDARPGVVWPVGGPKGNNK